LRRCLWPINLRFLGYLQRELVDIIFLRVISLELQILFFFFTVERHGWPELFDLTGA